jgi:hypothetical protein
VAAEPEITVAVRALNVELRGASAGTAVPGSFAGVLEGIKGTRLQIRVMDGVAMKCGTLVEVEAPETVFLGEIKHQFGGTVFIDIEHELAKSALDAIRNDWF